MKETIIIITILVIILGASIYTKKHLENGSEILTNELVGLKKEIDILTNDDRSKISEKAQEIYKKWEKMSKTWSVLVFHSELDLIETSLIRMKSEIETGLLSKAIEELDIAVFLIGHILEKEEFCWRNVF